MSTAVAQETVVFVSAPRRNYLAVRRPHVERANDVGQVGTVVEGVSYDFAPDGLFRATVGKDVMVDPDGVERDQVDWLRAHRDCGLMFVEEGREPGRQLPTEEEFSAEVVEATADLDSERLRGLLDEERSTHGRPGLIALVEGALRKVEGLEVSPVSGDGS